MRKMTQKIVALGLAATMALSLAGCTIKTADPTTAAETTTKGATDETTKADTQSPAASENLEVNTTDPITIKFSWWGGDSRHEATQKAVDAFMVKYPNITVETSYAAWDGWEDKMSSQFATGTAPDVNQINWNWITSFSSDGKAFYDLNKVSNILDLTQFPEGAIKDSTVADKLQGIPVSLTGRIFYWNETTFQKAGLETPKTLADLMAAGPIFKDKLGDEFYPVALNELDRMILMVYYLESVYGKPWVENSEIQYTEEEVQKGLDFIQSLEDAHVTPKLATIAGDGAASLDKNPKWMDGRYAGIFEWDSSAKKFNEALSEGQKMVVGEELSDMGKFKGGFSKVSMCFAISENTKHPAESAALINFLLNEEAGAEILASDRGIPSSKAGLKVCTDKGLLDPMVAEANEKVLAYVSFPLDPKFEASALKNNPDGTYYDVFSGLSYGDYDSKEATKVLMDGINKVLTK